MNQLKQRQIKIKFIKYSFLSFGVLLLLIALSTVISSLDLTTDKQTLEQNVQDKKPRTKEHSLTVQKAVFNGVTNDLAPYRIVANTMIKDKDNNYILESVLGECVTKHGDVTIKATNATLDELEKYVILNDNVLIIFNDACLKAARVNLDINTEDINSDVPVIIEFSNSYIKADKLESENYSEIIRLKGNVESVFEVGNFYK
jgi:LPS export ABC transporter protein LptC